MRETERERENYRKVREETERGRERCRRGIRERERYIEKRESERLSTKFAKNLNEQ